MDRLWTASLDVLGLLLAAAGIGLLVAGLVDGRPVGTGCGALAAGVVVLAASQLAARLAEPLKPDRTDGDL